MQSSEQHPDKLVGDVDRIDPYRFFKKANMDFAERDISLKVEALQARIDKISDKFKLAGYPVISSMLQVSHDAEELKGVARGLDRIADLIKMYDEMKMRETVLKVASQDQEWFISVFGDLEADIDSALEQLSNFEDSE